MPLHLNFDVDPEEWVGWPAPHYGKKMKNFKFADASIIGVAHDQWGRNNQDFGYLLLEDRYAIGVVADGCGSTITSEVGSTIGAQWCAEFLRGYLKKKDPEAMNNIYTAKEMLHRLLGFLTFQIAGAKGQNWTEIGDDAGLSLIENNFLFTLVGFVIDNESNSMIFSIGDGFFRINGKDTFMREPNNMPTYVAYALTVQAAEWDWKPKVREFMPTQELDHFVVATDGMEEFATSVGKPFPGKIQEFVPSLEEIISNDSYFTNQAKLQRLLAKMNPITRPSARAFGLLGDDTTIIIARRFEDE